MKPIIFSTPMVQAILDGKKTMTRRAIKYDFESVYSAASQQGIMDKVCQYGELPSDAIEWYAKNIAKPKYQPGDVLWVRETWAKRIHSDNRYYYKADNNLGAIFNREDDKWRPSIFMPREAARLFLKVTSVKVERLQDITEEDAIAEGMNKTLVDGVVFISAKGNFHVFWDSLNIKRGYVWDTNPWVFVYEFERISKEEALLKESEVEHDG